MLGFPERTIRASQLRAKPNGANAGRISLSNAQSAKTGRTMTPSQRDEDLKAFEVYQIAEWTELLDQNEAEKEMDR